MPTDEELSQLAFLRMDDGLMRNKHICSEIRILYLNQKGMYMVASQTLKQARGDGIWGFRVSYCEGDFPPLYALLLGVRGDIL